MKAYTYLSKNSYGTNAKIPVTGWIHQCVFCSDLTSMISSVYHYKIYCCGKCSVKYDTTTKYSFVIKNLKHMIKV